MDHQETKSVVSDTDTDHSCMDLLSGTQKNTRLENLDLNLEGGTIADDASLSDYIVSSYIGGRDLTGSYDGDGQVQFSGGNIYQGSLAQGLMHGKGKYIWTDGMKYSGDLTSNQITGYGRYEWPDKSYYEGEVLNGLRHGVGVFKSPKHNVSFSGQWFLGKRHGRGIMHYNEHSWYEGDWVNNSRHGWGVRRYHTGNVYEGQWINDKRHGDGTMRWLTTNESYTGLWENGVQHGYGTHTWYLHRVPGSQYPLRNEYVGDFVNGLRHGHGKFFFASGAVYDGEWENSKKHGWGKFIFKNGRVFEGQFENDHMVDYPTVELNGTESPNSVNIRSRTPVESEKEKDMAKDGCGNILGPNLTIDIDFIVEKFPEKEREHELKQVTFLMLRNISLLRRVYSFYSALGHDRSPDNTFVMTRFQFWRFLKDCRMHLHLHSLASMDRAVAQCHTDGDVHNPMEKLLLREFLSSCIVLGYILFQKNMQRSSGVKHTKSYKIVVDVSKGCATSLHQENGLQIEGTWHFRQYSMRSGGHFPDEERDKMDNKSVLAHCLQQLINEHILKYSCHVGGQFLFEPRRAVTALGYMDRCWQIYQTTCTPRMQPPHDPALSMRQFLFLLQDLNIIGDKLSTKTVLKILADDDPLVSDGETCNMEREMTFLEFFEAIVGCAVAFVREPVIDHEVTLSIERNSRCATPSQTIIEHGDNDEVLPPGGSSNVTTHLESHSSHTKSKAGAPYPGQFLQTLSQMTVGERDQDSVKLSKNSEEMGFPSLEEKQAGKSSVSAGENEFSNWCSRMNNFFMNHFFPAWNKLEALKQVAAKERTASLERKRIAEMEKEIDRRRNVRSVEAPSAQTETASNATIPDGRDSVDGSAMLK